MTISLGIPASILNQIQANVLERTWHEALTPRQLFRGEALPEKWPFGMGQTQIMSRPGLIAVDPTPLTPGVDPVPETLALEQWEATLSPYGKTIDTHMPTDYVSAAGEFLKNGHRLGVNAALTLNRLVRNRLMKAYLGGHTVNTVAYPGGADLAIRVAALNGFRTVLVNGRQTPVSAANPLAVTLGALAANTVVGTIPDDATDPDGPGVLQLGAVTGGALALRSAVLSSVRPTIIRSGGGTSVDALAAGDVITLQDIIDATARLRVMNVPEFDEGGYHLHIDSISGAQIFRDAAFQRLNTSLPDAYRYRKGVIGNIGGTILFENQECPRFDNSGAVVATPTLSRYSREIGAETVNAGGVLVQRAVVMGKGSVYEKYVDESAFVTEAGSLGKIGNFAVVNNGLMMITDRIRYIIRAPMDRLFEMVSQTWSFKGDFPVPSDSTSGDAAMFKRAVVIEHASQ